MRAALCSALLTVVVFTVGCTDDKDNSNADQLPTFVATTTRGAPSSSGPEGAPEIVRASSGGSVGPSAPVNAPTTAAASEGGLTVRDSASALVPADDAFVVALIQGRPSGPFPPSASLPSRDQAEVVNALMAQGFAREDIVFEASSGYGPFATIAVHVPLDDLATNGKKAIDAIESVTGRGQSSGVRFGLKDCLSALAPLRKEALAGAAEQATALAAEASVTLGPIVAVGEKAPAPIIYGPPQSDPCDLSSSIGTLNPGNTLSPLDARPEVKLSVEMTLTYSLSGGSGDGLTAIGAGKATAKANEAYVVVIAVPGAPTGPFAASSLSKKQRDDITAKLQQLKVDEDDIEIVTPSLGGGQTLISVETNVDNLSQRGKDITAAVEDVLGRSQQQGVIFGHSNCDAVLAEARKQALADAKRRAEALADAASLRLGQLGSLSEAPPVPVGPPTANFNVCDQDPLELAAIGAYGTLIQSFDAEPLITVATQVSVTYGFTGP